MNETVFATCVEEYCIATGAGIGVREHLLANYRVIVGSWKIRATDIREIAFRFVNEKRTPNWPKDHTEAIGKELDAIRKAQIAATQAKQGGDECPVCNGIGIVVVPHPCCIFRGKVCDYYNPRTKEKRAKVYTCAVICTAPKCWAGSNAKSSNQRWADETNKPKLLTMDQYIERVGYGTEPTVALREWEHEQAQASRKAEPITDRERDVFRSVLANILSRQEAWTEREPYRDSAEINEEIPA